MNQRLLLLILIVIFLIIPVGCAQDIVITQPSANETQFAEMRDFYVYGVFSPTAEHPGDFRIELYPESVCTGYICTDLPLRSIQSHVDPVSGVTNASQIDWSFVDGSTVKGGYVPDIIKEPGGYTDPNNKVVVTQSYYAGLVLGGVTKNYNTTYKNSSGSSLQDLTAGNYKIRVTGLSGDFAGHSVMKNITFGITNTALGTNRPVVHKNVRVSYAIDHGLRTYFDSFPGYFSDGGNNWSNFRSLAAPNNGIEVVNDLSGTMIDTVNVANNTLFVYNINSASTTYSVELAPILKYNLGNVANSTFLYYENGEPVLTYNDPTGIPRQVTSALIQFSGSRMLSLTRLEVRNPNGTSYENLYDPNDTAWKWVYTNLSGTISINQGQAFTIYGVTKPIPSTVSSTSIPYWYTIDNRISQLVCNISDTHGNLVSTSIHEVNLSRYYNNYPGSWNPYQKFNTLFEFGSEFTSLTLPGTYTVTLTGTDISSTTVTGTRSAFNVTVVPVADTVGVFRNGTVYLAGSNTNGGLPVNAFNYGQNGDVPVAGRWSGTGSDTVGIFRNGMFYFRNTNTGGVANTMFNYGQTGDVPVVGHWSGTGSDTVGIFRNGLFALASSNTDGGGSPNYFTFGQAGDKPVAGDWTGSGMTRVGIFRNGLWALASSNAAGGGTPTYYTFGQAGDVPVTGDWNADGKTEVGIFRHGMVYQASGTGALSNYFYYGMTSDLPVGGYFG